MGGLVVVVPRRVGGAEQRHGVAGGRAEILRQRQHGHCAVLDLHPFVAEHDVGFAVFDVERAVEGLPVARSDGAVAPWTEGAERALGAQNLCAAADAIGLEGGEQVVGALVDVQLGRPEVVVGPEVRVRAEDGVGAVEVLEVIADPGVEALGHTAPAGGAGGTVEVVFAVQQGDIGISDVDLAAQHGTSLAFAFDEKSIAWL